MPDKEQEEVQNISKPTPVHLHRSLYQNVLNQDIICSYLPLTLLHYYHCYYYITALYYRTLQIIPWHCGYYALY